MIYFKLLLLILFCLISSDFYGGQIVNDTDLNDASTRKEYYTNLNNQFILRFYGLYKTNNVNLSNNEKTIRYKPNGVFSFGVGFQTKASKKQNQHHPE